MTWPWLPSYSDVQAAAENYSTIWLDENVTSICIKFCLYQQPVSHYIAVASLVYIYKL